MSSLADHDRTGGYGRRLRRDRLAAGLTQEELAGRAGLSVRAISDLERGRTGEPRLSTQRRIAEALRPVHNRSDADDHPAPPRGPAQLPADVADFCGRHEELEWLAEVFSTPADGHVGPVTVAAVTGAGGIGKTTLALHAAHWAAPLFPDGQLYLNLHGSGPQPVLPAAALARFLRDLGMAPADVPADEGERAARYRSLTAGQRLLIVLDDVRDAAQVRPLIPGTGGCAVLVTSRNSLAGLEAAQVLELNALGEASAAVLFTKIVGTARAATEPEAVDAALAACAGLPLAIRIAATRLAVRPAWTIAALAQRLSDEQSRLDELEAGDMAVRASFLMSYASLPAGKPGGPESPQRAFRLLGLAEGAEVSLPAAAALIGVGTDSTERVLERLVDSHLLESPAQGRYRFHDLLQVYASERVRAEEDEASRSAAVRRMLRWYLHTAAAAIRVINPNRVHLSLDQDPTDAAPLAFASYADALGWLDAEHANLMICVGQAARAGEHEITWQLVLSLWDLFSLRGSFGDWLTAHETALASARLLGEAKAERDILGHLAACHFYARRPHEALRCLRDALRIARAAGEPSNTGTALVNLGYALTDLGQIDEALQALQEAHRIFETIGHDRGLAFSHCGLGVIHARAGRPDEAIACYEQAALIFRKTSDIATLSEVQTETAAVHAGQGRLDVAIESASEALELSRQCGSRRNEARALAVLGRVHRERGEPQLARAHWLQAVAIFTDLGHPQADELAVELEGLDAAGRLVSPVPRTQRPPVGTLGRRPRGGI